MDTEAVNDMNGLILKETCVFIANGGDNGTLFLDEQDDFVGRVQDWFECRTGGRAKELFQK